MVRHPETYVEDFRRAGARKIVFHYEATTTPGEVCSQIRGLGLKVGLAINPETPTAAVDSLVKGLDSVLFLSVVPGFYGSPFLPEVLDKIIDFRLTHPTLEIGIDGGIKEYNIAHVARSGVDVIYVGSAIYREADHAESYRRLKALAENSAPS